MTGHVAEVRFGRLERRGLLLGLSGAQVALVGTALVVVVAAGMAAGPAGLMLAAPVWVGALAMALVPVGGRPLIEVLPVAAPWAARRVARRGTVLAAPLADPVLAIPGVPGRLRLSADDTTGAGVIGPAARGSSACTVVARVRGRGLLLEGAASQDRRVAGWGRLLGSLSQLPHVTGVQVLHRTAPGGGADVARWWAEQPRTTAWANRIVADLVADTTGSAQLDTLLAVSLRVRRGVEIDSVLRSLTEAFDGADLGLECWLTPPQIARVFRAAYDPASVPSVGSSAMPMGVAEAWSHARSDSGFHATFWIGEWPRSATHPTFLRNLLLAPGAHRTFSLTAQPLPTGKALREIRRARAEQVADATTRARIGQVEDQATRAAAEELTRREEDLVAGHGDLRFTGLITVTATTVEELEHACTALQSSAGQAGCELRRLVGQQVQAFAAAALPLARVLA
ncbi:MAG: SCO6880 family protein [Sporichthyaceae bacterium]